MRFKKYALFAAALALMLAAIVPSQAAQADTYIDAGGTSYNVAAIPVTQASTQYSHCTVAFTVPPSTTIQYRVATQSTHYQFGYNAWGDPVHRVYLDGVAITTPAGSTSRTLSGLWSDVNIELYTGSEGVYGRFMEYVNTDLWNTSYQFGPNVPGNGLSAGIGPWVPDYRTVAVKDRVFFLVIGGQFLSQYRIDPNKYGGRYADPSYGQCLPPSTVSPF